MVKQPKRGPKERGTAALEFAFVMPIFIAMLGFIVSVGSAFWVRYQLIDHVTAAARACAMSIPTTDTSVQNCVPGFVAQDLARAPIAWCPQIVGPVVKIVDSQLTTNPNLHMVSVQLSCNMSWSNMMRAINGMGISESLSGTAYTVTALSEMPYLLPN